MTVNHKKKIFAFMAFIVILGLVYVILWQIKKKPGEWTRQNALEPVSSPELVDKGDANSLMDALDKSMIFLNKKDPMSTWQMGPKEVSFFQIQETVTDFKNKLKEKGLTKDFFKYINENYVFFKSRAEKILFTGYYEAHLYGSREKSEKYPYPLYRTPGDLVKIDLSRFYFYEKHKKLPRLIKGRFVSINLIGPYFSRQEIDQEQKLANQQFELVWVDNIIDLFFLHIQGSGVVELDDGCLMRVNYDNSNGHPYKAIGRWLVENKGFKPEDITMQRLRRYLEENPGEMMEIFNYNPSYVFFRQVEEGPMGSIQVPLTPMRSLATDASLFPPGALCYVETEIPIFDSTGQVQDWQTFSGFMLNQDTGGAIYGADKIDLFTGHGKTAELVAGHMRQSGHFYFLIKK